MAVQYSIQKMVSDGTLSTIALGIQYLQRNDIYMRIAGEETSQSGAPSGYTWSFINNTTLKILPVVPNGVEVVVYRRTDVDAMYNIYSQHAQFDEATIDENNQQLLYIAQEYLEQGLPGADVDTIEFLRDDGANTYYRIKRTDGSYSAEFYVPSAGSITKVLARESLRRSYAEAGYNLVAGSFESGGTLVNANDVLLHELSGRAYSGPSGTVSPGTNPASAGFVDMSGFTSLVFDSVSEMKLTRVNIGTVCKTLGYYAPGDGGGARYKILSAGTVPPDGFGDHHLKSGLVAVLDTSKPPSIMQYGARPDVAYNNKGHVQSAINAATKRYASTGDIQYVYSPPFRFEMGSVTESPRISMLSGVVLLSDGTKFKTASNSPIDFNWNANFLFGGLDTRISCINSGIKGLIYIDGNRQNNHPGDRDEKHSGIYISRDAENISFDDVVIEDPAGDGVVIAQLGFPYDRNAVPKNIKFKSLICRRAWRNGVSLIDYDNVHIDYLECTDTNGIAPQAGLDIEPNYWEARARNLYIGHYVSKRNAGSGLDVLQHNNNSEQRAGTIGRFDSDGDGEVMRLFLACGLTILDGVGKNSTGTYCAEIQAAIDLKVKMDFLNNHGGFLGEITKGWVSEPDVNGATHVVVYNSDNWDLSESTFRNNGGTQLSLKGIVSTDPVSGSPRTFKLSRPNLDGCKFDNGLAEGNLQSTVHLNIQSDVVNYSAKNISIASDATTPYFIDRSSSCGRIDSGSNVIFFNSVSYPTVPANGSVLVVLAASSLIGAYNEMTIRSAQNIGPLILSVHVGAGGVINMMIVNPTSTSVSAGSADFILTSSAIK